MNTETKMQFILDENKELKEIPREQCRPVEYPIRYRLKNAFEVFVRVDGTENYWISNYGRCVNNHRTPTSFYEHKQGKTHLTVFEVERYLMSYPMRKQKNGRRKPDKRKDKLELTFDLKMLEQERNSVLEEMQKADDSRMYEIKLEKYRRETTPADLVAESFLVRYDGRNKVWHKDGDESNNWYKNLLTVTPNDYLDLKAGKVTWQELNLDQEYIEYENKAGYHVYTEYNSIKTRCKDTKDNERIGRCYDNTAMWQGWLDDPKAFMRWYLEHSVKESRGQPINGAPKQAIIR